MGHKNKEGGNKNKTATGGEAINKATGGKKKKATGDASSSSSLPAPSVAFNPKDVTGPFELLDMSIAALHDKRASASTRESALSSLAAALERVLPLDEATDARPLVVFALCGASIKKGNTTSPTSGKEARLAFRAVGLLALTLLNGGSTEILAESFPMLAKTLQFAPAMEAATVIAALDCLAAVTFAGALGPEEAERSLKAIWSVIFPNPKSATVASTKVTPQVLAAAASTWTFLVTTASLTDAAQRKSERAAWTATVASLASLLDAADDRAVRMAAGEAMAVCVELNLTQHASRKDMEAVIARVSDLAAEAGGKGADKTLFVEQKVMFRQILAFMERGERAPTVAVRTTSSEKKEMIKASTWAKIAQLNFLRRFLGGGFLAHVKGNKMFKETFDVGADEKAALSIAKRKLNVKLKQKVMKMNRELSWAVKNVYCLPQGAQPPESNKPDQLLKLGWH
ncbi:hypothetical protein HU200_040679 [Digitaria exilis]|uniref:Interferon-related developmental regulator N-terminal domain-containing protein n=1 Tax=Digitaria exilis TaxID=1010633 RepID=A0A835B928_9POAL|nr:hypothetical protein HU200_040679 [Digitaria exilis]CAB3449352.1 unnamed protein product [Digitaria exilis]